MSDIQALIRSPSDLVGRVDPQQLHPEAAEAVDRDVGREHPRRARAQPSLDQEDEDRRRPEVPEQLVEEGRMEGRLVEVVERPVDRVDLEPPREVGRLPEELLVPPVAEPADTLGEEEPGREAVRQQPDVGARALRDDPADETPGRDPAPDPEPAAPDRERSPPLVGHLAPARREVVEASADDARGDAPDRAAEDEIPVAAAVHPPLACDVRRERDRREQGQAVHVDGQWAEIERARARRGDGREGAHGRAHGTSCN